MSKNLDRLAPWFKEQGKYASYAPVFNLVRRYFSTAAMQTSGAPHVRDATNLGHVSTLLTVSLLPCLIVGLWNTGYQANLSMQSLAISSIDGWRGGFIELSGLGYDPNNAWANLCHGFLYFFPVFLVSAFVALFWETVFAIVRGYEISEGWFVIALLFTLILPPEMPLWQAAIGMSFGIVIGKEIFGGTGMNIVNPALAGRAFLYFSYPDQIKGETIWTAVDGSSGATPLATLKSDGMQAMLDTGLSWSEAFTGQIQGSMGETSALACLIGGLFLIYAGIASWRIVVGAMIGMIATCYFFNFIGSDANPMVSTPWYWHMVLGGFAFGIMFLATDPVTSASTDSGRWLYGMLVGVLVIVIRVTNPVSPEGVMFGILLANIFAPLIDHVVIQFNIHKRSRYLTKARYP